MSVTLENYYLGLSMSKKVTFSVAAVLLLASTAFAADTNTTKPPEEVSKTSTEKAPVVLKNKTSGYYVGLGFGGTGFSDGDLGKEFDDFKVAPDKDSSYGTRVYGGYKFNKIVAVEGSFTYYGAFNYKYTEGGSGKATELNPWGLNVAANLGYDFLNDQLRPYGLIGLGYMAYNQSFKQKLYTADGSLATVYGFGVEYTPTLFQGIGFRLQFDSAVSSVTVNYSDPTKDDKTFLQSFNIISLNAQYKF